MSKLCTLCALSSLTEVKSQFSSTGSVELFLTYMVYQCGKINLGDAFFPCLFPICVIFG